MTAFKRWKSEQISPGRSIMPVADCPFGCSSGQWQVQLCQRNGDFPPLPANYDKHVGRAGLVPPRIGETGAHTFAQNPVSNSRPGLTGPAMKRKINVQSLFGGLKMARARTATTPWWLGSGTEQCSCCGHSHPYHAERRCEACDAGLCSCCASTGYNEPVLCQECKTPSRPAKRVQK
jgi:hypothetical protein